MPIPVLYRKAGEAAVASYAYTDLASGLGYQIYYGLKDSAGSYRLVDNADVYSDEVGEAISASGTKTFDSSTFNLPKTVKGKVFVNVPTATPDDAGNSMSVSGSVFVYDGTTETRVGGVSSTSCGNNEQIIHNFSFDATETKIKKGDLVRVKIQFIRSGKNCSFAYDPKARKYNVAPVIDAGTTQLAVHIPFKLDI